MTSASFGATTILEFDTFGTPYDGAGNALNPAGANAVTLTGNGVTKQVKVTAGTGKAVIP
jgi:hypothetical protein